MKKVLTVFLSIVLILAMMPSMAFAADDGKLYCFYANGFTVDDDGYLTSDEVSDLIAVQSIVVGREETLYFAIKNGEKYKVVNQVSCSSKKVTCTEKSDKSYYVNISALGKYEFTYTYGAKTCSLTMNCELPDVGCYSADTASENTYIDNIFGWSKTNNSFYIISRTENSTITSARFVVDSDATEMEDVQGVTISNVEGKNHIKKVTVDSSTFAGSNQELHGDMVVEYDGNSCSAFSFYIYGPNYNPNPEYDDTALYCFYAYDYTVDTNGYLAPSYDDEQVVPAPITEPSVVVGREETLYFAVWENGKFRVVNPNYENENVIYTENTNKSYEVRISKVGAYVLSYADGDKTYSLIINCELPYVGCYSADTASEQTYIDNVFEWSETNNSFYIVARSEACKITEASFVKEFSEDNTQVEKILGVTVDSVADKDYIKKVTVDRSAFTDESQEVCGDMVVKYTEEGVYDEGSYSAFSFYIEKAKPIKFYSDAQCEDELGNFSVNTSLAPENNFFYINSANGTPAISKITTCYFENREDESVYYAGVFDCNAAEATEKYYKYSRDEEQDWKIILDKTEYTPKTSLTSPKEFIEITEVDESNGIWKVQFKANGGKAYREHENMTFEFTVGGTETKEIDIDYGVNLSYSKEHFAQILPSHEYFGYIFGNPKGEPWIDENGYWNGLGGATSSDSDRCGSELWLAMDTTDGYRIKDIQNSKNSNSLPYTIQAEYYYKVYDKNNQEISVENAEYGGSISSDSESAFYATQYVGSSNYSGTFEVGFEDVTEFKTFCKENSYTATLIGSALVYTIFIPVDEQCEVEIATEEVNKDGDAVTTAQGKSIVATEQTATSAMQTNLNNYYKQGKEIAEVYELTASDELNGTVDVIIPVEGNPSDYEIVWFNNETPVPVVTRYIDGAVMFTTGHFSTYALVKNKTNTPSGGGGSAIIAPPAADDDVKTDTDSTTSQTTTSTTIKDTKTETTKDENGNDVSKTTATVSDDIAGKLVDQAVANKSDTVEITVKSDSGNKVDGENVELEIPKSAVKDIADKTDASLVINTDNGQVVLDNKTLETIASETEGDTVRIVVNENTQLKESQKPAADIIGDNGYIFDLRAYIGDKLLHDFKGGKAHVTLPMPEKLDGRDVAVIYINDEGICEILNHTVKTVGADKYIRFTTTHFSTYAIVESAAAEKLIKQQNQDKANTLIKEAKLAASTSKTSKKNVKITIGVKTDKSLIKELKSMGYTVKYKYYRSTKKASKYTALKTKDTNAYTNTIGKRGTKYYYKAKMLVYDGDTLVGQTALKQCSYGVRIWSK